MKKYVVITSINPPNQVIREFAARDDIRLVVAGDKKSPSDWHYEGVDYLSAEKQEATALPLVATLPWNHYCRKLMGYLHAVARGADIIIDTDDDNYPLGNWSFPAFSGTFRVLDDGEPFFNVYQLYSEQKIWPRGYPLDDVRASYSRDRSPALADAPAEVGIWQGLADEDPDVDAIYRLVDYQPCSFKPGDPVVLPKGTYCPFNSQNTAFRREWFPLLYLPSTVTFRFTDILRGYVAQPALWQVGQRLGFTQATVRQERNEHSLMRDFESEIPCYMQVGKVVECCEQAADETEGCADYLLRAYGLMADAGVVQPREIEILSAWLDSLAIATEQAR
jgi:hypothetical protein